MSYNRGSNNSGGGIGVLTVLTIVFIVLKLVGVIEWSWWWILAPTWIPFAIVLAIIVLCFIVVVLKSIFKIL